MRHHHVWDVFHDRDERPQLPDQPDEVEHTPIAFVGKCPASKPRTADALISPRCASRMEILAQIHPPDTPRAILDGLGLASRPPPIAPARSEPEQLTLPDGDREDPAD